MRAIDSREAQTDISRFCRWYRNLCADSGKYCTRLLNGPRSLATSHETHIYIIILYYYVIVLGVMCVRENKILMGELGSRSLKRKPLYRSAHVRVIANWAN